MQPEDTIFTDEQLGVIADTAVVVSKINDWFVKAKSNRDKRTQRWRKNEELIAGDHWKGATPSNKTKMVFNFPLANKSNQLTIISDNLPVFDVLPDEENDIQFADMMQKRKTQIESKTGLYDHVLDAIDDALQYSNGFIEILPQLNDGKLTGLDISVPDPFTCFWDPWATGLNLMKGECLYYIFAVPMYVEDIEKEYGVKGVQPEGNLDEYRAFTVDTETTKDSESNMALVKECFYRDPDTEKYPNGRFTAIVGNMLLVDEPIELIRNPHFMVSNYKSSHNFTGMGEPELDRTITKAVNEFMSAINENFKKTGNPARKITQAAKAKQTRALTGSPGEEIIVDHPNDFTFENPPSVPSYAQHFVNQVGVMRKEITGNQDAMQGAKPPGVIAASAIMALQEAAQGRVRFKIEKEIKRFIKDIGEFIIWILQTYDEEIITIRERDNMGQFKFVTYDPVSLFDSSGRREGEEGFDESTARTMKDSKFDIDVSIGHRSPGGRIAKEARATELFEKGIYGIERWAAASNEPDKQGLIREWYQRNGMEPPGQEQNLPPEIIEALQVLGDKVTPGSPEEEQLLELVSQLPQIVETPEFQEFIPPEVQQRIVEAVMAISEQGMSGSA